jgi:hypothetical protein
MDPISTTRNMNKYAPDGYQVRQVEMTDCYLLLNNQSDLRAPATATFHLTEMPGLCGAVILRNQGVVFPQCKDDNFICEIIQMQIQACRAEKYGAMFASHNDSKSQLYWGLRLEDAGFVVISEFTSPKTLSSIRVLWLDLTSVPLVRRSVDDGRTSVYLQQ